MSHVFGPIARDEFTKLLDLDFEYDEYHLTLNERLYVVLPTILRGTALSLLVRGVRSGAPSRYGRCALRHLRYHAEGIGDPDAYRFSVRLRAVILAETVDPAPRLAVFRTFADKRRKLHPAYGDRDMVEDLHTVLRSSAASSPYVTPLYLVVIRDINNGRPFTFASLASELEPPPRADAPPQGASAMTVRFSAPAPTLGDTTLPADDCSMDIGGGGGLRPVSLSIRDLDDEEADDWPAFRDFPLWVPSIYPNDLASTSKDLHAPPPSGAQ
ncbi:hypothetical protein CYMTET_55905 [Cymbomonas tetramitiformis]|uniref:Uncharacterized protein n=1 Tax=Cymbomonas tetramitiformis TaxID=36881 RepID=A0AAE0BD85_9CHLO|nr:hypothetical protein CYMTET_55905 [Cymbomonas tetramitiformis]